METTHAGKQPPNSDGDRRHGSSSLEGVLTVLDNSRFLGLLCGVCVVSLVLYIGSDNWEAQTVRQAEVQKPAGNSRVVFQTITNGGPEESTAAASESEAAKGEVAEAPETPDLDASDLISTTSPEVDLSLPNELEFSGNVDADTQRMIEMIQSDARDEHASLVRLRQLQAELEKTEQTGTLLQHDIRRRQAQMQKVKAEVDRTLDQHVQTLLAAGIDSPETIIPASASVERSKVPAVEGMDRENVVSMLRLMGQRGQTSQASQVLSQMSDSRVAELLDLIATPDQQFADELANQLINVRTKSRQ